MTDEMLDFAVIKKKLCLYSAFDSLFDALFLLSNKGWDIKRSSQL